jgi:peptidoglycan/xylan/chitin deacetylase (PgdA/CDA1 family)
MNTRDIYLTFDDGPHPDATPSVLNILRSEKIKGTFFLTGSNVSYNRSLVKEIFAEGHSIGIHAYTHRREMAFSKEETKREIRQTESAISETGAAAYKLFRPPFGFFSWNTISAAKDLKYKIVMWTTLTGDFRRNWPDERVTSTALSKLAGGAILVLHDNEATKSRITRILPDIIGRIRDRGFTFQSIEA